MLSDAFNWAAQVPERPFTLGNEFNRLAGNPEYGGFKFGRGARIVDRLLTGAGVAALILGTGAAMTAVIPGAAVTSGGIVMALGLIKVGATAAAALTEGVVKVGNALLNKKAGVGSATANPTPKP